MNNYYWIIIVVAFFLMAVGYDIFRRSKKRARPSKQPQVGNFKKIDANKKEPNMGEPALDALDDPLFSEFDAESFPKAHGYDYEPDLNASSINDTVEPDSPSHSPSYSRVKAQPERLLVLNLVAEKQRPYMGYELLQALLSSGMRYGKMNIFHRHEEISGQGPTLFSVATLMEPGTFDMSNIGGFSCPGLTFFMQMPLDSVMKPLQVFELMLQTVQQMAEDLGGDIREGRTLLSPARVTEFRRELQPYSLELEEAL